MKKLLVLLAIFLILPGCQKEDTILNSPPDQVLKEFTISGSADGTTTFPYGTAAPFRHFVGTGQSSPGGDVELILDYLVTSFNPSTGTGTSGFASGEIITASGDKIYAIGGQGTFSVSGTIVTFSASAPISGGTGEYDNLMGTLNYTGTLNQLTGATHAEWTGTFTRKRPISGEAVGENVTVTGSCATGFVRRHIEADGNAIHFGKMKAIVEHCFNPQTGIITEGVSSLEAANGDKLFITHNGYGLPVPGTNTAAVNMFCTITGGEGRFENATGSIWLKGIQIMPAGATTASFDGVIDY